MFTPLRAAIERVIEARSGGPDPYLVRGAKTPNMRIAWLACGWAWAAANHHIGSAIERERCKALHDYIVQQRTMGLQCRTLRPREERWSNEQLTASHHDTWSHWMWALAALLRRWRSPALAELAAACSWWIGAHLALWALIDRHRSGVLAMAGARAGSGDTPAGKDGVDTVGPRIPQNDGRDREWRLVLAARGEWSRRLPSRRGFCALAIKEGYLPEANAALPHLAEPMTIRWHGDGSVTTSCESSPGQGGAQHVELHPDGSWAVLGAARTDDVEREWTTP